MARTSHGLLLLQQPHDEQPVAATVLAVGPDAADLLLDPLPDGSDLNSEHVL